MYSFIVFCLTALQLGIVAVSYFMGASEVFYNVTVYGSPFYSAMTLLGGDSILAAKNRLFLVVFIYHIFKYGLFFMAQTTDGRNGSLTFAIIFEALYLCISGYYLN